MGDSRFPSADSSNERLPPSAYETIATRAGVEIFYTGAQTPERDPYRTVSAPFATIGVLVSQRVGRELVYLNGDDLADVRQTRDEPLLLPGPTPDGRLTVDPLVPPALTNSPRASHRARRPRARGGSASPCSWTRR